jgi:hypothetical protein
MNACSECNGKTYVKIVLNPFKKGGAIMKRKKIVVAILVLALFVGVYLAFAADYKYVGSAKSNKYHYPNCQWAQKIKSENLVTFKSAKEALAAGYVPCTVCKPPTED